MKRLGLILTLVSALGMVASAAWAEEAQDAPKKRQRQQKRKVRKERKPQLPRNIAEMAKVCELTEEQQKQVADLNAAKGKALKDFHTENAEQLKAVQEAMKQARQSKDKEAMKKAFDDSKALRQKQSEISKKFDADMLAVLTAEQKAKWDQHQAVSAVTMRLRGIKLSDEQTAQVKAAFVKEAAGTDMNDAKAKRTLFAKLDKTVRNEILNDEQRKTLEVGPVLWRYGRAKLTDEQKEKIKAAYSQQMSGVDAKDRKAKAAALRKLHEHISSEILTDEQREAVKPKARKQK